MLASSLYPHDTMRTVFVLALAALLAMGCGQRGPLYLRESPPPGVKPERPAPYEPVPYPKEGQGEDEASKDRKAEQAP